MFSPTTSEEILVAISKIPKQEKLHEKFTLAYVLGDITQMVSKLVNNGVTVEDAYSKARKHYYNMSPEHTKYIGLLEAKEAA